MIEKTEPAVGDIDGANTTFQTTTEFRSGTVRVYVNGDLQHVALHEEHPPYNVVVLQPPEVGDTVNLRWVVR